MDYKSKYKAIPKGYQHEVLKIAGNLNRMAITRYFNSDQPNYHTSAEKRAKIENAIDKVFKPHNLVKHLTVTLGTKIIADHPTAKEFIRYCDLTFFKIQLTGTIGEYETVEEAVENGENDLKELNERDPYALKLLISKYILHDTRNNH